MDYQQALSYLESYTDYEKMPSVAYRAANYNPKRLATLLEKRGYSYLAARTVHIAGTKGKGSTAAMIASVLTASGRRTGLYTSPHLLTIRERIRVDGEMVSEAELVDLVERLRPEIESVNSDAGLGRLTTFEILTALALTYFQQRGVEFQVLEVGLGGRLDATNVVTPEVCVITSISLDHTDVLGDSLLGIAAEKAGIIKPGCTVVISPQRHGVFRVLEEVCSTNGVESIQVGQDVSWRRTGVSRRGQSLDIIGKLGSYRLTIPLLGDFQLENAATAIAALEVLMRRGVSFAGRDIVRGMARVSWLGRLQVLGRRPLLVVDGAHNVYSMQLLREALRQNFDFWQAILVIGTSCDKDIEGMVAEMASFFHKVIVTRSRHPRAADPSVLARAFTSRGVPVETKEGVAEALQRALSLATRSDLICVTGSLFVVGEALEFQAG
ncbi:bifunctional folylpolyglutamate synthase/dihydrofolate synthase [Chloroflexota bacterium]